MTDVNQDHIEKETLVVAVYIPGHDPRVSTPLFDRTRKLLIEREGGRCWISGQTAEESGHPLEAHHYPIERSFAEAVDWPRFANEARAGHYGPHAQAFDWAGFLAKSPIDPYLFVDDMTANGLLLAKEFHTAADAGVHMIPHPMWIAQKFLKDGFKFSDYEIIHHPNQQPEATP